MEDSKILDLFFARSEEAITQSKAKYGNYCRVIAENILRNHEDAMECLNDTWLSAWNTIPPKRPQVLSTYLGKLARNHALDSYRRDTAKKRGGAQVELVLEELEDCIASSRLLEEEVVDRNTLAPILDRFLGELPRNARILFLQRYWYLMSVKEIARQNNMGQSAVKMSLLRSREALKQVLRKEGLEV